MSYLEYSDGKLYHQRTQGRATAGAVAGCATTGGYWRVWYMGRQRLRHQVIWELHRGPIPRGYDVDHKNATPGDDRIENLQLKTRSENMALGAATLLVTNTSGYNGVDWSRPKQRWRARCQHAGRSVTVGYFEDACKAHSALVAYKDKHGLPQSRRQRRFNDG